MSDKAFNDTDRKALGTMRVHVNRDGNGLAATTLDGKPLPEETMNPAQREAFRKFEALSFPKKETAMTPVPVAATAVAEAKTTESKT